MERNFSVDDIVGTLWKLDTTSSSRSNDVAADTIGLDEVFKRIPRVDSDWAFQDFFKLHDSAKAEGSDTIRRNESMWALQEFLKNYDLIEAANTGGDGHELTTKDNHADERCALDLNASPGNTAVLHSTLNVGDGIARNVDDNSNSPVDDKDRQNTEFSGINSAAEVGNRNDLITVAVCNHPFGQSNTSRPSHRLVDSAVYPNLFQSSEFQDHYLESSTNDAFHTEEFREQQVSGALSPLFTGLQNILPNVSNANPQEYEMMLKRQLDLACAAVASKRAQQRPVASHASTSPILKVKTEAVGPDATEYGDRKVSAPLGIPALPPKPKGALSDTPRINTSGSSGEHSDDEADVESGAADQAAPPDDIKRVRRMLSNRESARRSRRRKQAHLNDLEMQVAQMRAENSSLFKQLTEIAQKLNSALLDNQVLKSDVKALRSKIKMAEDLLAKSTAPAVWIGTKNEAATPLILQCGMAEEPQNVGGKMGRTPSMQRIASLEHLQKKIRGGVSPSSWGTTWQEEGPMEDQGSPEKE